MTDCRDPQFAHQWPNILIRQRARSFKDNFNAITQRRAIFEQGPLVNPHLELFETLGEAINATQRGQWQAGCAVSDMRWLRKDREARGLGGSLHNFFRHEALEGFEEFAEKHIWHKKRGSQKLVGFFVEKRSSLCELAELFDAKAEAVLLRDEVETFYAYCAPSIERAFHRFERAYSARAALAEGDLNTLPLKRELSAYIKALHGAYRYSGPTKA